MSQTGTVTPTTGASVNVGTAPGALSVGIFTNNGPLAVDVSAGPGQGVTVGGGAAEVLLVASGVQVTAIAKPPLRPDLYGGPTAMRSPGPPTQSSLTYLIGTLA